MQAPGEEKPSFKTSNYVEALKNSDVGWEVEQIERIELVSEFVWVDGKKKLHRYISCLVFVNIIIKMQFVSLIRNFTFRYVRLIGLESMQKDTNGNQPGFQKKMSKIAKLEYWSFAREEKN